MVKVKEGGGKLNIGSGDLELGISKYRYSKDDLLHFFIISRNNPNRL